ncbi:hypothetical protein CCUS01_06320 [Colletotrichum cuscutae]|uniref:Uncharacterized protein n=1 Tax=Colletotrichum cuscutae TaxID=1209917 RepID=A0AAI9Y001_9PEZI|nr:hypothetical protein CCUS01_06320 [Colletotrichum cuscutae]
MSFTLLAQLRCHTSMLCNLNGPLCSILPVAVLVRVQGMTWDKEHSTIIIDVIVVCLQQVGTWCRGPIIELLNEIQAMHTAA